MRRLHSSHPAAASATMQAGQRMFMNRPFAVILSGSEGGGAWHVSFCCPGDVQLEQWTCVRDMLQCTDGTFPHGKGMEDDVEKEEHSSTRFQNQKYQST